jgi:hypothetical protein
MEIGHRTQGLGLPQIGLHARINDKDEEIWMTVDVRKGSASRVSLLGKVLIGGRVQRGRYNQTAGPPLSYGDKVKLSLKVIGNGVTGYIDGKQVITAQHSSRAPLPKDAGAWGFRTTYLTSKITKIEWAD